MAKTTMEERWKSVEEALATAKGICWDGCHKIYVLMDDGQVAQSRSYDYDVLSVAELGTARALELLREWFDESCPLRFINSIRTVDGNPNDGFTDLIPQFADDEDNDSEEE